MRGRIVWIDDDADTLEPLIRPLRREGYVVDWYLTAAEALEHREDLLSCRLLIFDILLPSGTDPGGFMDIRDGVDFLRRLRNDGVKCPVVVVSVVSKGRLGERQLARLRGLGIDDRFVFRKPILPSQLARAVREALAERPSSISERRSESAAQV